MKKFAILTNKEKKTVDIIVVEKENLVDVYKRNGFSLMDVEQGKDGQWYLEGFAPKITEKETLLEQLENAEKETGYNRLTRDLILNVKKLGGTVNQAVYKKVLEVDALAKKYRKSLKEEGNK